MTAEANVQLLRRAWAAYDKGDEAGFASCLTDDWREFDSAGDEGTDLAGERRAMHAHRLAFPDKHTEIHRIVADEETVACHCTVRAHHTGKYFDAEPTGKEVVLHEMMFNSVRDGRLCATWGMVDGPGFYEQITGKSAPEQLDNMG